MTKAFYLGASALALLGAASIAPAHAADMYSAPASTGGYKDGPAYVSWAGFYAGVNGGGAWSASSDQFANTQDPFVGLSPSGGFGGGQIGYNWQGVWHPHLVIGVEADIQGADISDSATDIATAKFRSQLNWFGTIRGRLGYATDSSLVYATGGFAYGDINNRIVSPGGNVFRNNGTETGYAVGAGMEYKLNPAWSVKAEYQYLNFGKNVPVDGAGFAYTNPVAGPIGAKAEDDAFHTVRIGLNYHFFPVYTPLK